MSADQPQQPHAESFPDVFRTSLALNNSAVDMMRKGCFLPALKTMNESLGLVNSIFMPTEDSTTTYDPHEMFQIAARRSANSKPDEMNEVEVHSIDDDDFMALREAVKRGPSASLAFYIRISESDTYSRNSNETARRVAILNYNHGLASYLASKHNDEDKTGKYLKESSTYLQIADTILCSLIEGHEEHRPELSYFLLSAMVLNCLSLVFDKQDEMSKSEEAQYVVSLLCSSVDGDRIVSALRSRNTAAAA